MGKRSRDIRRRQRAVEAEVSREVGDLGSPSVRPSAARIDVSGGPVSPVIQQMAATAETAVVAPGERSKPVRIAATPPLTSLFPVLPEAFVQQPSVGEAAVKHAPGLPPDVASSVGSKLRPGAAPFSPDRSLYQPWRAGVSNSAGGSTGPYRSIHEAVTEKTESAMQRADADVFAEIVGGRPVERTAERVGWTDERVGNLSRFGLAALRQSSPWDNGYFSRYLRQAHLREAQLRALAYRRERDSWPGALSEEEYDALRADEVLLDSIMDAEEELLEPDPRAVLLSSRTLRWLRRQVGAGFIPSVAEVDHMLSALEPSARPRVAEALAGGNDRFQPVVVDQQVVLRVTPVRALGTYELRRLTRRAMYAGAERNLPFALDTMLDAEGLHIARVLDLGSAAGFSTDRKGVALATSPGEGEGQPSEPFDMMYTRVEIAVKLVGVTAPSHNPRLVVDVLAVDWMELPTPKQVEVPRRYTNLVDEMTKLAFGPKEPMWSMQVDELWQPPLGGAISHRAASVLAGESALGAQWMVNP